MIGNCSIAVNPIHPLRHTCHCCHCPACQAERKAREDAAQSQPASKRIIGCKARRPLACLVFLLPLLAIYEAGVIWTGGDQPAAVRNGADAWMRSLLETAGVPFGFVLPALVVVVLLGWHLSVKQPWKVSAETLMGMFAESLLFAFALIVAGQLQNLAFEKLGNPEVPLAVGGETAAQAVTYVGAGIYEEVLFRLCLLPACFGMFRSL